MKVKVTTYLTVTVWRIIAEGFDAIQQPIPNVRELTDMIQDDEKVWALYEKGLTATLNQAGTDSGTPQAMQYKPRSVRELSGWVSAIRPAFASMKHYFLNRLPFSYGIPAFDQLLETSDNFILYQEDIMKALVYAGFSEDVTYGLLKAIAKKKPGIIEPIQEQFIDGFTDQTGSRDDAFSVWQIIEDAVGYGFNSSHAYSVALDSLYGAYLKANHPLDYYSVVLNIYQSDTKMQAKIMHELAHFQIPVLPIAFGKSQATYSADHATNQIYKGVASIKYLNASVADQLYSLAQNQRYDAGDFVGLLVDIFEQTNVDTRQMEILIRLDFFRFFGDKEVLLEVYKAMSGKEKVDVDKYPAFRDVVFIETKKKRDGTIEETEKRIKKPVVYSKGHVDATKALRIQNAREFEQTVRANPPEKVAIDEQLAYEKDHLGYAVTVFPGMSERVAVVLSVNKRYKPAITLYQLATGQELFVKVDKKKFYSKHDVDLLYEGDVIQILDSSERYGWKKVDDKWVENRDKVETHLEKVKLLRMGSARPTPKPLGIADF